MIRRIDARIVTGAGLLALAALAACGGEVPPPPPPPQPPPPVVEVPPPPPGPALTTLVGARMSIHTSLDPNVCLDDKGGGTSDGNPVALFGCHGRANQVWAFGAGPNGANIVTGVGGKCLNINANPSDPSGATSLWTCNGSPSQLFKHYADGRIHDGTLDKCLTANDPTRGSIVTLEPCNPASQAQVWNITEAPPPPPPVARVVVSDDRIALNEEILFKTGSAEIDPQSDEFIAYIAFVLKQHDHIDFIEVAGHADQRGNPQDNVKLTQARADAVVKHLAADGVNPKRLRAVGYGAYCPVDPAMNEEAWKKNRRVELVILRRNGKDMPRKWDGCDAARTAGMKPQPIPVTAPRSKEWVVKHAHITRKGFQLVFSDQVRFEPGTANIVPATEPALDALKEFLAKDKGVTKIRIEGHTDPPDTPEMLALSKQRSRKVAEWLVNHGVDPNRVVPVGCGGRRPIMTGKVVDEALSRRTEAHVVEEKGQQVSPPVPGDCSMD